MSEDVTLFTEVDRTGDPDFFIRFLDAGHANPDIQKSKPMILDGLNLRPGLNVLDLGCGTGADALDIAQRLAPSGAVTGVDVSGTMIAKARRRAAGLGLPVAFEVGNATQLRFAENTFDACRTERMLMHIAEPVRAFAEMVRVTKRDGHIAVFDFDWDTFVIDNPHRATTRRVVASFSDSMRSGWIGRQLRRMFLDTGMIEVTLTCHQVFIGFEFLGLLIGGHLTHAQQAGALDPTKVKRWWDYLREADAAGRFLAGLTAFIVSGRKA
ncbi:MAG: methyltransferase domain-containing protein [Verrucomicrobia bacterium]|nr:methyltransferase domain-containing protein [Verrucomicrobiota bacterium]